MLWWGAFKQTIVGCPDERGNFGEPLRTTYEICRSRDLGQGWRQVTHQQPTMPTRRQTLSPAQQREILRQQFRMCRSQFAMLREEERHDSERGTHPGRI